MIIPKIEVEVVDKNGKTLRLEEKYKLHKNPVALHKAVSVLIFNKNKILLQKRALSKVTWPGFWANTTCTHPLSGEDYKTAAERRLKEEMGFSVPLTEIFRFTYSAKFDDIWGENEYDVVFRGEYSGEVKIDPNEAESYRWVSLDMVKKDVNKNPEKYTPWFKNILNLL